MAKPNPRAIELWVEFLQLSDRSKWTKQVEEDFGDVWAPDFDPLERKRWFKLFVDMWDAPVLPLRERIPEYMVADEDRYVAYAFDLTYPRATILKALKVRLDSQKNARDKSWSRGRPKHRAIKAKYKLCRRPNIPALEKILAVYKLREKNPKWKLYQIGQELRLNENQMPHRSDSAGMVSDKRRVMTAIVARYLRQAKEIIKNVQKGIFPLYE
jgi:hypothetical protein